jgi:hypothetical protein
MLKIEQCNYIVYPNWIEPRTYSWGDIPKILEDPLAFDKELAIQFPPEKLEELEYPKHLPSFSIIEGNLGGGIVKIHSSTLRKWLPFFALTYFKGIDLSVPGMMSGADWKGKVSYLENHTYLDTLELGRKRKNYVLPITPEHIEALDEKIYWLFCLKQYKRKKEITFIDDILNMANHFKLNLLELTSIPNLIPDGFRNKMPDDEEYLWFEVKSAQYDFGYHFAVLMYTSLCLCPIAGQHLLSSHLLANIEGEPHFCF